MRINAWIAWGRSEGTSRGFAGGVWTLLEAAGLENRKLWYVVIRSGLPTFRIKDTLPQQRRRSTGAARIKFGSC